MEKPKVKALALFSGGLDSILAVKLVLNQGIEVEAVTFTTPFTIRKRNRDYTSEIAKKLGIPLRIVSLGKSYLSLVKKPKHGYGKNMNPCIDCRIFMLKKAKKIAKKVGAEFIFTGEVLDERPMSQNLKALKIIEEEAGLKGRILRPLSAKLLPKTKVEEKGFVDRNSLLNIRGRTRKMQITLAKEFGITDYEWPSGGCLLTYKEFSNKLRDLLRYKKRISISDLELLRVGRHFRSGKNKIIVGRNSEENKILLNLRAVNDYCFEVEGCGSPVTLLQGRKTRQAIKMAAQLTAYYSDWKKGKIPVKYGKNEEKRMIVEIPSKEQVEQLRIK